MAVHRALWWTGAALGASFFVFWLSMWYFGFRDPVRPDALHRYPYPYKPWVYLTPHEAVAGYAILAVLVVVLVVAMVLTEVASRQRRRPTN